MRLPGTMQASVRSGILLLRSLKRVYLPIRFERTTKSYSGYPQKTDREIPVFRLTAT